MPLDRNGIIVPSAAPATDEEVHQHKVFRLSTIISNNVSRIEDDPEVIMAAVLRVLCAEIVTENAETDDWPAVRAESVDIFGKALDEARALWKTATPANSDG